MLLSNYHYSIYLCIKIYCSIDCASRVLREMFNDIPAAFKIRTNHTVALQNMSTIINNNNYYYYYCTLKVLQLCQSGDKKHSFLIECM